jgi:hypothetical protein
MEFKRIVIPLVARKYPPLDAKALCKPDPDLWKGLVERIHKVLGTQGVKFVCSKSSVLSRLVERAVKDGG